jgi:hypothetical protein
MQQQDGVVLGQHVDAHNESLAVLLIHGPVNRCFIAASSWNWYLCGVSLSGSRGWT